MEFLPKPKEVKLLTGEHALCYDGRIVLEGRLLGNGDAYAKVLQQGIQKETGMQYQSIDAVEKGGDLRVSTLRKIAKALNVDVKELL